LNIDALRGVAIILVVTFHIFPEVIPKGFVEVGVFCYLWIFNNTNNPQIIKWATSRQLARKIVKVII